MKYAEYVQQMKHLPMSLSDIEKTLNDRPIKRWAYCIHDKDELEDGTPKEPHIHIEMEFNSQQTADTISGWFNDKPNRIQKSSNEGKRKFVYENMVMYLMHKTESSKKEGKYEYPIEEVHANFNVAEMLQSVEKGIKEAKEQQLLKQISLPLAPILERIANNEIPRIEIDNHISTIDQIKYKSNIETAYNIRDRRQSLNTERTMDVMFFYGESGSGKTTIAKKFSKDNGYGEPFITGSSNDPLEGYIGQKCIILDDTRGEDWKLNDFLKLTDNHTNSLAKSRYSNKLLVDCQLMIITSIQKPSDFLDKMQVGTDEPKEQFKRRCNKAMHFTKSEITVYSYDEQSNEYIEQGKTMNPIPFMKFFSDNKEIVDKFISYATELKNTFE